MNSGPSTLSTPPPTVVHSWTSTPYQILSSFAFGFLPLGVLEVGRTRSSDTGVDGHEWTKGGGNVLGVDGREFTMSEVGVRIDN